MKHVDFNQAAADRARRARQAELICNARIDAIDRQADSMARGACYFFCAAVAIVSLVLLAVAKVHGL